MLFAPSTPPWRRRAPNEETEAANMACAIFKSNFRSVEMVRESRESAQATYFNMR